QLFTSLSCVNCHEAEGTSPLPESPSAAMSLARLAASGRPGCLGKPRLGAPHFGLDDPQVKTITAALSELATSEELKEVPLEFSLLQQNCYACHTREDRGGIGTDREQYFETVSHVDLGDEGRLPPPLDHVG